MTNEQYLTAVEWVFRCGVPGHLIAKVALPSIPNTAENRRACFVQLIRLVRNQAVIETLLLNGYAPEPEEEE